MPGKACERYIFHVMAYAYFFEMPDFHMFDFLNAHFSIHSARKLLNLYEKWAIQK